MSTTTSPFKEVSQKHKEVLRKAEQFNDAINNLFYEGKVCTGRNITTIEECLEFFQKDLIQHMQTDELKIFPFIQTHIPRLEMMIDYLKTEHDEFRRHLSQFEKCLKPLKKESDEPKRNEIIQNVWQKGTYIYCLITNHIRTENVYIYKPIGFELKEPEINKLLQLIHQ